MYVLSITPIHINMFIGPRYEKCIYVLIYNHPPHPTGFRKDKVVNKLNFISNSTKSLKYIFFLL